MLVTRRGILATLALAQSNLLGGCFGGSDAGSDDPPPDGGGGGDGSDGTSTATAEPTAEPTETATATPVANADLAASTAALLDEFEWYRTEYEPTIVEFRRVANGVIGVIDDTAPSGDLTSDAVDDLEAATTAVADYAAENLVDHFAVDPALRTGDNVYVRDFRRAVRRGDVDAQDSVLGQARLFYSRVTSNEYIRNEFSRRPVYDALYDMLIPDGSTASIVALAAVDDEFTTWAHPDRTESTADDGVERHTHEFPSGHRVFTHAHTHSTPHPVRDHTNEPETDRLYAYTDGTVALLEDAELWRERMDDYEPSVTDVFGPVRSSDRSLGVYSFVAPIGDGFDATPLYLERFPTPDAAAAAVEAGPRTDGTTTFAGREWDRVFYDRDGVTLYAYRVRVGATVVTASPSPTAWERRPNWAAGLGSTWLGVQSDG
jgi:hypothetical protein